MATALRKQGAALALGPGTPSSRNRVTPSLRSRAWVFITSDRTKGNLQMPFTASKALPDQTPWSSRPAAPQCFLRFSHRLLFFALSHARSLPLRRWLGHSSCCKSSTWTGLQSGSETGKFFPLPLAFAKWPRTLHDRIDLHGSEAGAVISPISRGYPNTSESF